MEIIVSFVILFLLKVRFPRHRSISQIILTRYNLPTLQNFRSFEKLALKLRKITIRLSVFCIVVNLLIGFLNFYALSFTDDL